MKKYDLKSIALWVVIFGSIVSFFYWKNTDNRIAQEKIAAGRTAAQSAQRVETKPLAPKDKAQENEQHTSNDLLKNCDKAAAQKIFDMLRDGVGVKFDDHGVNLFVDINSIWNEQSLDKKNQLLQAIANADACIQGKARGIMVYAWGEKVAEASPYFGLKVIK